MESLSLLEHCQKCRAKCCIPGKTIGAPIVSGEEILAMGREISFSRSSYFEVFFEKIILPSQKQKYYYVPILKGPYDGRCIFLTEENRCAVQETKFADCRAYPIKALRKDSRIILIIDTHCPAARHLAPEFIAKAKEVALQSLEAWDPEVYQHWLDHYIEWTKDAMELETYLKLSDEEKAALPVY